MHNANIFCIVWLCDIDFFGHIDYLYCLWVSEAYTYYLMKTINVYVLYHSPLG